MDTEYNRAKTKEQREALARKIAGLRKARVPWDGPSGIVDAMHLVSGAGQGRDLLREFKLDAAQGGPVEIQRSYDRYEINPRTGQRMGHREPQRRRGTVSAAVRSSAYRSGAAAKRIASPPPGDPLIDFARGIERETGRQVPIPNAEGPTTKALVLFVLRDPGATETSGANETNVLDPHLNSDPTALRQQAALSEAGIDRSVCVWWNASPYHLGYWGKIREADCARGAEYLRGFMRRCPDLIVVVAMGLDAQAVASRLWQQVGSDLPRLRFSPHPMFRGKRHAELKARLADCLREVAELIRAH